MLHRLKTLFDQPKQMPPALPQRPKLQFQHMPDVIYAVGDVHGCLDLLVQLETLIARDAQNEDGEKVLILLGDYVDRGPESAGVLRHAMQPRRHGMRALNLAGNHEEIMLDFLSNPVPDHAWLRFGGVETLHSYGLERVPADPLELAARVRALVPPEHIRFLAELPSLISFPDLCFVHGGTDPQVELKDQRDEVLLWKRPDRQPVWQPYLLVHGHTPVEKAEVTANRVNIDTGAYATGVLSAVKIKKTGEVFVVSCSR